MEEQRCSKQLVLIKLVIYYSSVFLFLGKRRLRGVFVFGWGINNLTIVTKKANSIDTNLPTHILSIIFINTPQNHMKEVFVLGNHQNH